MRKGLSEAQVEAALGELDRADLPAKTIAALRLVDVLSAPQPTLDTATYQRLREHLDDREDMVKNNFPDYLSRSILTTE
jgi:hypothetical protein